MHILGQNKYDKDFYKKILSYFMIKCIDDQILHYAFSKKIYCSKLYQNNEAFMQTLHVLSKSSMQQAFLAKICTFFAESTYST